MVARLTSCALLLALSTTLVACAPTDLIREPSGEFLALEAELASCRSDYDVLAAGQEAVRQEVQSLRSDVATLDASVREIPACEVPPAAAAAETVAAASAAPVVVDPRVADKLIVGRRERVWIEELQLDLRARVDTGSETSSLDARNITEFERDGNSWVRFEIPVKDGEPLVLEQQKVREAAVGAANSEGPGRKAVIKLGIRLGDVRQLAEFTLSDRGNPDLPMLIGRNVLRDVMLVDVSATYLVPSPADGAQ